MVDINQALLSGIFGGGSGGGAAGDITDITNFGNSIAANDYWKMAANPILQTQFDRSSWSPMTSLGVSAGQSFLGALLHGIGQRDEAAQLQSVASILPQLYSDPSSVMAPEGVDAEAFGKLKLATMTRNQIARAAAQAKGTESIRELLGSGIKAELEAAGKEKGTQDAKNAARKAAGGGEIDPEDPAEKKLSELRRQFEQLDEVKDYKYILKKSDQLANVLKNPSAVTDTALAKIAVQLVEPRLSANAGETAALANSSSIPEEWKGDVEKALKGGSKLGPTIRQGLIDLSRSAVDAQSQSYKKTYDLYGSEVSGLGLSPKRLGDAPVSFSDYFKTSGIATLPAPSRDALRAETAELIVKEGLSPADAAARMRGKYGAAISG